MENSRSADSIETQIAFCTDYINVQNDLTCKGFFDDVGYTGTNMNRPRFSEMMAGILGGEIKCIVVKDLSRLGRTYIEVGELLFDTFLQFGVRFISINDNYDSFAPDAGRKKLLILVKNLKNNQYSKDLAQKVKSVVTINQKNGKLNGGVPPYGYWFTEDKQSYQVIPEAAEVVKNIFNLYNTGMGAGLICEYLNANSFPAPRYHYFLLGLQKESSRTRCQTWMPTTLFEILRNKTYTGCLVQGKYEKTADGKNSKIPRDRWIIHPDKHPAIISNELFNAAQNTLSNNGEKCKRLGVKHAENIFVGKTFCSRCNRAVVRDSHANKHSKKKIYPAYHCRYCLPELKRANNLKGKGMQLRLADLEAIVFNEIKRQVDVCLDMDALLKKAENSAHISNKRRELTSKREKLIKKSERAVDLITAAYTHHASGLLDENEFNAARIKFERDKQNAVTALAKVEEQILGYDTTKARESSYMVQFRKYQGIIQLDKDIINTLIKRIDITPLSNEVAITFNFKDSFGSFMGLLSESEVSEDVC